MVFEARIFLLEIFNILDQSLVFIDLIIIIIVCFESFAEHFDFIFFRVKLLVELVHLLHEGLLSLALGIEFLDLAGRKHRCLLHKFLHLNHVVDHAIKGLEVLALCVGFGQVEAVFIL